MAGTVGRASIIACAVVAATGPLCAWLFGQQGQQDETPTSFQAAAGVEDADDWSSSTVPRQAELAARCRAFDRKLEGYAALARELEPKPAGVFDRVFAHSRESRIVERVDEIGEILQDPDGRLSDILDRLVEIEAELKVLLVMLEDEHRPPGSRDQLKWVRDQLRSISEGARELAEQIDEGSRHVEAADSSDSEGARDGEDATLTGAERDLAELAALQQQMGEVETMMAYLAGPAPVRREVEQILVECERLQEDVRQRRKEFVEELLREP